MRSGFSKEVYAYAVAYVDIYVYVYMYSGKQTLRKAHRRNIKRRNVIALFVYRSTSML